MKKIKSLVKDHQKAVIIASSIAGLIFSGATVYGAYRFGRTSFRKEIYDFVFGGECKEAGQILGMLSQVKTVLCLHAGNNDVETVENAGKLMQKLFDDESCKDSMKKTARGILLLCDD